MVLRYYGVEKSQLDFLNSDKRIKSLVEHGSPRGLNGATISVLVLERGFKVTLYGRKLHITNTFTDLGGKVSAVETGKQHILKLLLDEIPPIVKLPSVSDIYVLSSEQTPSYIVVKGVTLNGRFKIVDPWYEKMIPLGYWDKWSSNIIAVEGRDASHSRA